jgi:hypothetical protein
MSHYAVWLLWSFVLAEASGALLVLGGLFAWFRREENHGMPTWLTRALF